MLNLQSLDQTVSESYDELRLMVRNLLKPVEEIDASRRKYDEITACQKYLESHEVERDAAIRLLMNTRPALASIMQFYHELDTEIMRHYFAEQQMHVAEKDLERKFTLDYARAPAILQKREDIRQMILDAM